MMAMPGHLTRVTGLACPGRHGAYPGERDRTRTFRVDCAVWRDVAGDVVDELVPCIRAAVAAKSHALLERVAADVVEAILALPGVIEVEVRVAKPDPPGLAAREEAVSFRRSAARSEGP